LCNGIANIPDNEIPIESESDVIAMENSCLSFDTWKENTTVFVLNIGFIKHKYIY